MEYPDDSKIVELVNSAGKWSSKQELEACEQMKRLYRHWFRKEPCKSKKQLIIERSGRLNEINSM